DSWQVSEKENKRLGDTPLAAGDGSEKKKKKKKRKVKKKRGSGKKDGGVTGSGRKGAASTKTRSSVGNGSSLDRLENSMERNTSKLDQVQL
ncbi:hypothetical protein O6379_24100, partial [Salmonella enterica subsp. enterica]|uniref:hypothetical protein n=1 Tax=Salmonella enterica TaxID=28901 RepID=UPI0022B5F955|nr:hypothetical protein [Salmonella enterica]